MLTLDTLRRMAERMGEESVGASGESPFRRPDSVLRVREVDLPPLREEARRGAEIGRASCRERV